MFISKKFILILFLSFLFNFCGKETKKIILREASEKEVKPDKILNISSNNSYTESSEVLNFENKNKKKFSSFQRKGNSLHTQLDYEENINLVPLPGEKIQEQQNDNNSQKPNLNTQIEDKSNELLKKTDSIFQEDLEQNKNAEQNKNLEKDINKEKEKQLEITQTAKQKAEINKQNTVKEAEITKNQKKYIQIGYFKNRKNAEKYKREIELIFAKNKNEISKIFIWEKEKESFYLLINPYENNKDKSDIIMKEFQDNNLKVFINYHTLNE